jgi:hypothetical protein
MGLSEKTLEPGILRLQLAQALYLVHLHAAIAPAPAIEGLFGQAVTSAQSRIATPSASASWRMPTIWASVNLVCFMSLGLLCAWETLTLQAVLILGAGPETLKGPGPFTVFAPTDEAFAKVPKATLDALAADPKGPSANVLTYHVVPGKVTAAQVKDGLEAATVQGATVKFTVKDGSVMINDAKIVQTDIECSNGVIHVIDAVILPPSK